MNFGSLLGTYTSDSIPFWVHWFIHIPVVRQKVMHRSVSHIQVFEQGIVLRHGQGSARKLDTQLRYTDIRRVWFEEYNLPGDDKAFGFRIDIIGQNLDVLFSMKKVVANASDSDYLLMKQLSQIWHQVNWKHYNVVAAVIQLSAAMAGRTDLAADTPVYLCMQKGNTRFAYTAYHWEFPGGKIEEGESETEALCRELREEMNYQVAVVRPLITVDHSYPDFSLRMSCYLCTADTAQFERREHADHRWLTAAELSLLDWCDADKPVAASIAKLASTAT